MADLLKNRIDKNLHESLARALSQNTKIFNKKIFLKKVEIGWDQLELKDRIRQIAMALNESLNCSYVEKIKIFNVVSEQFSGQFGAWIFPQFVEMFGLDDWDTSVEALKKYTSLASSEFAVRVFIQKNQKKMMKQMLVWSKDKNEHVRRLASEGCRPLLPWSFKLRSFVEDPSEILPILENLKNDESLYVRKSVANNLNDISKNHPELVLKIAQQWIGKSERTDWILKHGLRTLLKRGHKKALTLFGVKPIKNLVICDLKMSQPKFIIGHNLEFSFVIKNKNNQKLRIEYVIHYLKKNNSHSKKVFKLAEKEYNQGVYRFQKKHSLRQMTTRQHNPGLHYLEIVINGNVLAKTNFNLK